MTNRELCDQAWRCVEAGELSEAQRLFAEVLARDATNRAALHGCGRVAQLQGHHEAARDLLGRALRRDSQNAELHFHLAISQHALNRVQEAIQSLRSAIALQPGVARYHAVLGTLWQQHGQLPQAAAELKRAIQLDPADARAHVNLSSALLALDDVTGAEAQARRAIELDPSLALAHANLGAALNATGRFEQAAAAYRAAVGADPADADAHLALGLTLLTLGEFDQGWSEYEWRSKARLDRVALPNLPRPLWGGEDPGGRRILVHNEQGLGDTIQFARYLPMLAQRGAVVLLHCQKPLVTLMRSLPQITVSSGALPDPAQYDAHVPLLSLGRLLGTRLGSIPAPVPYLRAPARRVEHWRERLAELGPGRRIGLCWAGNPEHRRDRLRSIDPALLTPLAALANIQWISLQKQRTGRSPPLPLHDVTHELGDMTDTAALVMNLDLVVTVDTAVAHLAGALGRPVWTLIAIHPDWRWLAARSDSPWYPTMRLFRQHAPHDWPEVISRLVDALAT